MINPPAAQAAAEDSQRRTGLGSSKSFGGTGSVTTGVLQPVVGVQLAVASQCGLPVSAYMEVNPYSDQASPRAQEESLRQPCWVV